MLPCASKATAKAISPRVAPRGTVSPLQAIMPRVALNKAFQSYEKAISLGVVMRRPLQARGKDTSLRVVPNKALIAHEK